MSEPVRGSCVTWDVAAEDVAVVLVDVVPVVVADVDDDPVCEDGGAEDSFLADPRPVPPCASATVEGDSATRQTSRSSPARKRRLGARIDRMGLGTDMRGNASPSIPGSPRAAPRRETGRRPLPRRDATGHPSLEETELLGLGLILR